MKAPKLGPITIAKMIARWGSPKAALEAGPDEWRSVGLQADTIDALLHPPQGEIDIELEWANQPCQHIVTLADEHYPWMLRHIPAPPPLLYIHGDMECLGSIQIAMVGSRRASISGREFASQLAADLADCGITVTSGLAVGIDGAAHRGALQVGGVSVAVLGSGLRRIYPARHGRLAAQLVERGALVSECALMAPPHAYHFPRRNRIISGLSQGVVVVEATLKSGSLITVRHALDQGRDIFAVPGAVLNPAVRGCHDLIKQGARLVENHVDIISALSQHVGGLVQSSTETRQKPPSAQMQDESLDSEQQKLLECVDYKLTTLDCVIGRIGWDVARVNSVLLMIELKGYITRVSGGYLRVR